MLGCSIHREIDATVAFLHITSTSRLLDVIKADNRAIFTAAAKASEAARYLKAFSSVDKLRAA